MADTAICLMGPTASGKTDIALELRERLPLDLISVDSALVYRDMDIGTAKPDAETLARVPHKLIDIRDPEDSYSAGEFVRDARREMQAIFDAGRIPLLVGGTMMYFRALTAGIAELPAADPSVRAELDADALEHGWPAMHARLAAVDAESAARINPNDSQRIQRALEVYLASGRPLSIWQAEDGGNPDSPKFISIGLQVEPRSVLHRRIDARLQGMLDDGFLDEVTSLMRRPGLGRGSPSMRSVGYRQFWGHLAGDYSLTDARIKALAATRQLAKRQLTWMRGDSSLVEFDALESGCAGAISAYLAGRLS